MALSFPSRDEVMAKTLKGLLSENRCETAALEQELLQTRLKLSRLTEAALALANRTMEYIGGGQPEDWMDCDQEMKVCADAVFALAETKGK